MNEEMSHTLGEPKSIGTWIPGTRTPRGRDASMKRSLAKVREAHHSALAAGSHPGGGNREALLPSHPKPIRNTGPFLQQGLLHHIGLGNGREGTTMFGWRIAMFSILSITLL